MSLASLLMFLVVSLIGVITKKAFLVLLGSILSLSFVWFQAWYPLILTVPFILFGVSIAIRYKMTELSWILYILSFLVVILWVVKAIHSQ